VSLIQFVQVFYTKVSRFHWLTVAKARCSCGEMVMVEVAASDNGGMMMVVRMCFFKTKNQIQTKKNLCFDNKWNYFEIELKINSASFLPNAFCFEIAFKNQKLETHNHPKKDL